MNKKINLFTLLIFTYSAIVCLTFKKGQELDAVATGSTASKIENTKVDSKVLNLSILPQSSVAMTKLKSTIR